MEITINLRVQTTNTEFEASIEEYTTGNDLLNVLFENDIIPALDQDGNAHVYHLLLGNKRIAIQNDVRLIEFGVQEGDTMIVSAEIHGGAIDSWALSYV